MAATGNQTNISRFLLGNTKAPKSSFSPISTKGFNTTESSTSKVGGILGGSGIKRVIAYLLAILVVIFVILLFIHYFIKPVFSVRPGSPGIIPIPGFDDGKLFWNKTSPGRILNRDLPIAEQFCTYSFIMDMFIQNPLQFSSHPRILFSRGAERKETPGGDTMLGILNNYNLVVGLLPDTNDLIVSVLNKDNNMENVIIPNIPVQEPFRLGVVFMEMALEVYVNGLLIKTRKFDAPPKDVRGDIFPASGIEANIAKLRNLKMWSRLLTTGEVRYATPPLSTVDDFNAGPIPNSSTCATEVRTRLENLMP